MDIFTQVNENHVLMIVAHALELVIQNEGKTNSVSHFVTSPRALVSLHITLCLRLALSSELWRGAASLRQALTDHTRKPLDYCPVEKTKLLESLS